MGLKIKKKTATSKRIFSVAKRGGFSAPILSMLRVIGLLDDGTAEIAKAMNDNKAMQRQLEELKRHNHVKED